ncbi:MAG: adenylate/guanylate cyclase domain-containing protein, partial [candidate division WOR-3 bacterium]
MIRPERRNVAVLFADIKGFTSLSETLDPEDLQEIIDTIFREFKNIIEKNGGYLDKFIGDAVMAVFGVPLSKGDDARRAIVTALQMQELLKKINEKKNTDIKLRIGINFGEALWSSIAGEKPTVLGDTVNVSQRVEELAEPGKIYVTASVYEIENKNFYFREVGNFKVRGREEPVKVFEILGEKPNINEFSIRGRFVTPFTGREQEIEKLIKWYSQVRLSEGIFFVDIQGEAGIGKTRFCSELKLLISEKFPD